MYFCDDDDDNNADDNSEDDDDDDDEYDDDGDNNDDDDDDDNDDNDDDNDDNIRFSLSESCFRRKGYSYEGTVNITESNIACQPWNQQTPHSHSYVPEIFPQLVNNYCRNPSLDERPWCYTSDVNTRWGYCLIDKCSKLAQYYSTLYPIREYWGEYQIQSVSVCVSVFPVLPVR